MRTNHSAGARTFGRFLVHPDKLLVRVYPIKAEVTLDSGVKLWLPPHAQKRDAQGRWCRILQVGKRVSALYPDMYRPGMICITHKYVDNVFGREGKFRLGGVLVAVTMPSEVLLAVEFDDPSEIPDFIKKDHNVRETV